jgi:tetratricopeptide (TPR) repeat protein
MNQINESLAPAIDRLRRGDRPGARAAAEAALAADPDALDLLAFAGLLAAQSGDPAGAAPHFRRALKPGDMAMRVNLATALIATGAFDEAATVCAEGGEDPKLLRLGGYVHQASGRLDEAASAYERIVSGHPQDFESWNNLGNVRAAKGEWDGAIAAFRTAITLRPDIVEMVINLSDVFAKAERHEERAAMMLEAARVSPDNVAVQTELGLALSSVYDFEAAERAFRAAIRRAPRQAEAAWLELGLLLENLNRVDDLAALVVEAEAAGVTGAELGFIKAWSLRRLGRHEEALPLAEATPETINPVRRTQLLAELYDRIGDPARAFAAFTEMNRAAVVASPPDRSESTYRAQVAASAAQVTSEWVGGWTRLEASEGREAPAFIIGFPRSGTTLLDTLLMNGEQFHVLEELPVLRDVEAKISPRADIGQMAQHEADFLRTQYFTILDELSPPGPGREVIDKHPLHMVRMPLISRIFPDARIILVERHPCDAVLSCFMANFQLNHAMRSFTDLEEAARTYDMVFDAWTRAEALLPLNVHRVRYERMIQDLESEMRPLLAFLGQEWDPAMLDNRAAAAARGHVRTASYSQVTEPIYTRSSGRWERYREQMAPVLPILAPWAERMGYSV